MRGQGVTAFASLAFPPNAPTRATGPRTVGMFDHHGWNGGVRRAEDPLSGKILSACRVPPRAAYGEIRKPSPEAKKGYTYDAVLRINARRALSLYGRGIVKRRKGDIAGSEADIATALAIRPGVADYMAQYGIK